MGSNLGGIRELVESGVDGLLMPHNDPAAWAAELDRLAFHPERIEALKMNIKPPRTMQDTARDTLGLYEEVLAGIRS